MPEKNDDQLATKLPGVQFACLINEQCDHLARSFIQYLYINNNEQFPNSR